MKAMMGVSLMVGELVGRDIVVADILDPSPCMHIQSTPPSYHTLITPSL